MAILSQSTGSFPPDFLLNVSLGNVPGHQQEFIIGVQPDLDTADGSVTIWDSKFSLTRLSGPADIYVSSSSAADVGQVIVVSGLDADYNPLTTTATLNGQNQVITSGQLAHVQSALLAVGSATLAGDVYVATAGALTGGVPNDNTTVKSKIRVGNNFTRNGFYMVPTGFIAVNYANRGTVDTINKSALVRTLISHEGALAPWQTVDYTLSSPGFSFDLPVPGATSNLSGAFVPTFPERSFLEFRAQAAQNDTRVFFGSDIMLVEKNLFGAAGL